LTATTTNFGLPYPTALDEPCDFAVQWCAFTDAVQTVIDGFQDVVDRTNPVIPIARLEVTTPVTIVAGSEIPFDSVTSDTASWVDFDADPRGVTINRAGRIVMVGSATCTSTGVNNNYLRLFISGDQDVVLDRTNYPTVGLNTAQTNVITTSVRRSLKVTRDDSTTANITVERATFSVFWFADRATP
jgi:hypothetical protein